MFKSQLTSKLFLSGGILLIGILLLSWPSIKSNPSQNITQNMSTITPPEWFATEITTVTLNEEGKLLRQLYAKKMLHYAADETTTLTDPHLILFQQAAAPWEVTANSGQMLHGETLDDITQLDLWENVKIWRAFSQNNPNQELTTSELSYFPKDEFAHSDAPVTLAQPGQTTYGTGMDLDLKTEQLELLSTVRGQHETNL